MEDLFALLFLFSFIGLVVGLIKPSLVLRWLPYEQKNRKNTFKYFGIATAAFFILFAITAPPVDEESANKDEEVNELESGTEVSNAKYDEKATEEDKAEAEEQAKKDAEAQAKKEAEEQAKKEAEALAKKAAEEQAKKDALTTSQKQAIKMAESYLNYTAFSRTGLIEQLEFEGFSNSDATFAVDNITVDWQEQANQMAQDYLDYSAFSRSGLIDQLIFEGFSNEHASRAATSVGL